MTPPLPIYLDSLHSSHPLPKVIQAQSASLISHFGNPIAKHSAGRSLSHLIHLTKQKLLDFFNLPPNCDVHFTSNGSEAVNMAVQGTALASRRFGRHLIVSVVDQSSVLASAAFLETVGFEVTRVRADDQGRVDMDEVLGVLRDGTVLVCVQAVNQDLGTIQSIGAVAEELNRRGIPLVVDGVFGCGWVDLEPVFAMADGVALSFHRFFGPIGIGAYVYRNSLGIEPLIRGGGQGSGMRGGMENYHAVAGLDAWLEVMKKDRAGIVEKALENQRMFLDELGGMVPHLYLNGPRPGCGRSAGQLNFSAPGIEGQGLVLRADLKGVALGSGSACLGSAADSSQVLRAIGASKQRILSSFSACPSPFHSATEIRKAAAILGECIAFLRAQDPEWEEVSSHEEAVRRLMDFENRG